MESDVSVRLFISYAHDDEAMRKELDPFLKPLVSEKLITVWHDREITAGADWDKDIEDRLRSADIILLLMSQNFLASTYINDKEVVAALERHKSGEAVVIPVILRKFTWSRSPVKDLQSVPRDLKAVSSFTDRDEAWTEVTDEIIKVAEHKRELLRSQARKREAAIKQFRQKVDEALSDGKITPGERDTLDELRASLELSAEDAAAVVAEAEEPLQDYRKKITQYEATLLKIIADEYPLNLEQRKDLDLRQRDLGIKADDAAAAEAPILVQAEKDYQARLAARAAENQAREDKQRKQRQEREADERRKAEAAAEQKRVAAEKERVEAPKPVKPAATEKPAKPQKKVATLPVGAQISKEPPGETVAPWRLKELSETRLAVIDPYTWISETLAVSRNQQCVAWQAKVGWLGTKYAMVVNGKAGPSYSQIYGSAVLSDDGRRVAYQAQANGKPTVVVDGKEGKAYSGLAKDMLVFSADSRLVAYGAVAGDKWIVVVDGNESKACSALMTDSLRLSADGRHVVYGAATGDKWLIVVDGLEGKAYSAVSKGSPVISADGRHVAYGAAVDDKWVVVVDGKEGPAYSGVFAVTVSADGRHVAHGAAVGDKWMMVVDGKEGKLYSNVLKPVFSADSQHLAYGALAGDQWLVVVDGREGKRYENLLKGSPVLSADGRRVAYGAKIGDQWMVVVDGNEGKSYSGLSGDLTFSPDGRHFAYTTRVGDKWVLVVDGNEQPVDLHGGTVRNSTLVFDSDGGLHWLAIKGNEILQATARMQPEPKTSKTASPAAGGDAKNPEYQNLVAAIAAYAPSKEQPRMEQPREEIKLPIFSESGDGDRHVAEGIKAYEKHEFDEAIKLFQLAISLGVSKYPLEEVYAMLGNSYQENGSYTEALTVHKKAIEINPNSHKNWVNIGVVYRLIGDLDEAERCYEKAITIKPDYAELHASLGALYIFRDNIQKAKLSLEKSLSLDPQMAIAHANMSLALAMEGDFEAAYTSLKKAVSLGYRTGKVLKERIDNLKLLSE